MAQKKKRADETLITYINVTYRSVFIAIVAVLAAAYIVMYFVAPAKLKPLNDSIADLIGKGAQKIATDPTQNQGAQQAHFTNIDGSVRVKKASTGNWVKADYSVPLDKGDVIQTGPEGIARIVFADGTNYTVNQDSLIMVQENSTNASLQTQVAVQVTTGTVDLATATFSEGSKSQVIVAGATATLRPETSALVSNDPKDDQHAILVKKGSANVERNGESVSLGTFERVSFKSEGGQMARDKILAPPTLISPANMLPVFAAAGAQSQMQFSWTPVDSIKSYRIRISKNPYFTQTILDKKVPTSDLSLTGLTEGSYYWVVQSLDDRGRISIESERNKFTVVPKSNEATLALELEPPIPHGHRIELKGKTEPSARVMVNGEEVPVIGGDGAFHYYTSELPAGQNVITITAQNSKGGTNTQTRTVIIR